MRIKAGLLQRFLVRIVSNSLVPAENVLFVICVSKNEAKNIQNFLSFAKGALFSISKTIKIQTTFALSQ